MNTPIRRRDFVKASAVLTTCGTFGIFSSSAKAVSPNGKLRTAHIGVGGMGRSDLDSVASHSHVEVAALCDVDANHLMAAHEKHSGAKTFRDFRELLATMADTIDAVVVSTPDHTHAPAAMTALNHGKPVYCQKPLTHDVYEARQLRLAAQQRQVPTQMGIQVHSSVPYRRAVAMIQSGAIGKVSQVHAWSNKNWGYDGGHLTPATAPPEQLDWNLWLGTAQQRPYVRGVFHPGDWRRLVDFGTGTLGDMGVHIFDTPYAALELTAPTWVETTCRPPTGIGHPEKLQVQYEFPATRHTTDRLIWTWYDGALAPPELAELQLPEGMSLPGQGSLFIGEEGAMLLPHVSEPQLLPAEKFAGYERPAIDGQNHYHQWVDACLGNGQTSAPFEYGGPLTEALLLGVVAARFPSIRIHWDTEALLCTDVPDANRFLRRTYRDGFEVDRL